MDIRGHVSIDCCVLKQLLLTDVSMVALYAIVNQRCVAFCCLLVGRFFGLWILGWFLYMRLMPPLIDA